MEVGEIINSNGDLKIYENSIDERNIRITIM